MVSFQKTNFMERRKKKKTFWEAGTKNFWIKHNCAFFV